jgi:hypothetical protein
VTGKIALVHMREFADYYERLERMDEEASREWPRNGADPARGWVKRRPPSMTDP